MFMVFHQFKDVCDLHMNRFNNNIEEFETLEFLKEIKD